MRIFAMFTILLINFILQTTVFHNLKINGIFPNTALIIITAYSLLRGRKEGIIMSAFAGGLFDIFFAHIYGFYTIPLIGISYFIGRYQEDFYRENYILPVFFCTIASFLYESYFFLMNLILRGGFDLIYLFIHIIIPTSIYTATLTIPIYRLLFSINEYFEFKEKYKYRRYY